MPVSVLDDSEQLSLLPDGPICVGEEGSSPTSPARRRRNWLAWALMAGGLAATLYGAWSLWGTGLVEARAQSRLLRSFREELVMAPPPGPALSPAAPAPPPGAPAPVTLPTTPPATPEGRAVAVLKIPRIGLEKAVVEGVSDGALRKGPGHYPSTPLPGQPGNAAVAGHRTTYGAPFSRIDELAPGDPILVTTRAGTFRYEVTGSRVIRPSEAGVLGPSVDNRLTLTTCTPKYRATQRLVVTAVLVGGQVTAP